METAKEYSMSIYTKGVSTRQLQTTQWEHQQTSVLQQTLTFSRETSDESISFISYSFDDDDDGLQLFLGKDLQEIKMILR